MKLLRSSDRVRTAVETSVGVFLVGATYVLFLLWDQFGFLRHLEAVTDSDGIHLVMAAMGVSGLLTSLATGYLLGRRSEAAVLRSGFALAAVAVPASLWVDGLPALSVAGAALGVATGMVTVSLATGLRRWLPGSSLAMAVGIGTGLAYFVCNVPWLFEGSGAVQAGFVTLLCVLAVLAPSSSPLRQSRQDADTLSTSPHQPESYPPLSRQDAGAPSTSPHQPGGRTPRSPSCPPAEQGLQDADTLGTEPHQPVLGAPASRRLPWSDLPWPEASLLLAFLALVWLDSAAFAVIQETLTLKGATWATPAQKWLQGTSHLLAAVAAGFLLRRGHLRGLLVATYVLFGVAFQLLHFGGSGGLAGPIYAVGISLYSTALVVAPTLTPSRLPIRWRAAVLYGFAGWLGSALGVGMAQDLHRIPGLFIAAADAVLILGWISTLPRTRELLRLHAVTLAGVALAVVVFVVVPDTPTNTVPSDSGRLVDAGREVYIAEGCMGCHSQYVRPRNELDLRLYGPHRPLDRSDSPPLVGLRRQGPDLSNVGRRHDAHWLRRHLMDPRRHEAASAMPSYRFLFEADSDSDRSREPSRGDALVAYLQTLTPNQPPNERPNELPNQWASQWAKQ